MSRRFWADKKESNEMVIYCKRLLFYRDWWKESCVVWLSLLWVRDLSFLWARIFICVGKLIITLEFTYQNAVIYIVLWVILYLRVIRHLQSVFFLFWGSCWICDSQLVRRINVYIVGVRVWFGFGVVMLGVTNWLDRRGEFDVDRTIVHWALKAWVIT